MPRHKNINSENGKRIIIIDDHRDYLDITTKMLTRNGYEVISFDTRDDIINEILETDPDLLLLDYFMPGNISCENFIDEIRKKNPLLQILLQTGYSGEIPPRQVLKSLDIQGYFDKATGPENLLLWIESGIKISSMIKSLNKMTIELNKEVEERKKAETELLEARKNLEVKVKKRTEEITIKNLLLEKEIAEKAEREYRYTVLIDNLPQKVFVKDLNLKYISCNTSFLKSIGLDSIENIYGKTDDDFFSPGIAEKNNKEDFFILENCRKKKCVPKEYDECEYINGKKTWTRKLKIPLKDKKSNPYGILSIFWDISEFKKNEEKKKADEFRYVSLLELNHMYDSTIENLLDFAMNTGIKITNSGIGYIYFYDEDTETFTNYAWSREVMDQCKVADPKTVYDLKQCGLWGEVVRQRKPVITNDYAANIYKKGLPEGHVSIKRHLSIPVFSNDRIVAAIGVGNKPENYDEYDVQNLTYIMDEVWKIIKRKEIEAQIRDNEEEFKNIFKQAAVGICYTTLDGKFIKLNKKFCEIIGYNEKELDEMNFNDIIYFNDIFTDFEKINDMIDDKISINTIEKRLIKKDKALVWVNLTVSLSAIFATKERYIITIVEDISQRKLAEETIKQYQDHLEEMISERTIQLKESESNFRNLFETSPVAISIYQTDGRIINVNEKFTYLFGYEIEDIPDMKTWYEKTFPDEELRNIFRNKWGANLKKAHNSGNMEFEPLEERVLCKDGTYRYIQFHQTFMGEKNIVSFTDLTARKEFEDALKISENKYRVLTEEISDGIFSSDENGRVTYANKSMAYMLGYEFPEEIIGKNYLEFISSQHYYDIIEKFNMIIAKDTVPDLYEISAKKKDGSLAYLEFKPVIVKEGGTLKGFRGTMRDISERKKTELELQKTLVELQRSNSELEQFAYIASHDLQEPLRVISSYLQLLEKKTEGKLEEGTKDFMSRVINASSRMQNMINDLLDYSRITFKKKPFRLSNINEIVKNSLENLKFTINNSKASVTISELPELYVDESQILRIFQNLISNAIKFCKENQFPEISISSEKKDGMWVFAIRDNGIGIENEFYERIFQIFQRLHTRDKYPGNGIGLASCKKIIERHGGQIWLESNLGKGTVFYFSIPDGVNQQ